MKKKNQNYTIDLLRFISAFGVIAIHVKFETRGAELYNLIFWPIVVPFFYISSLTYFVIGLEKGRFLEQVKKIFNRLIVPYLSWTTIYICLFFAKGFITGNYRHFVWWRVLFYGESAVQLYFIPTLLSFQALALGSYFLFFQSKKIWIGLVLLFGSTLYLVIGDIYSSYGVIANGRYIAAIIYIITAFLMSAKVKKVVNQRFIGIIGIILGLFAICSYVIGFSYNILQYLPFFPIGGIGVFLFCIGFPNLLTSQNFNKLTSTSFGIYLCHVIFLEAFEFIVEKGFHNHLKYDFWVKTLAVSLIYFCSILLVILIRKNAFLRGLLLGEKTFFS